MKVFSGCPRAFDVYPDATIEERTQYAMRFDTLCRRTDRNPFLVLLAVKLSLWARKVLAR